MSKALHILFFAQFYLISLPLQLLSHVTFVHASTMIPRRTILVGHRGRSLPLFFTSGKGGSIQTKISTNGKVGVIPANSSFLQQTSQFDPMMSLRVLCPPGTTFDRDQCKEGGQKASILLTEMPPMQKI